MHIGLLSPAWPVTECCNGIVTYVHELRGELLRQGHRVSVFTNRVAPGGGGEGVHPVEPTLAYRLQNRLSRLGRGPAHEVLGWGRAIAAAVERVDRSDPLDILEMEESFGWCGDVQRLARVPLVVKLHGPAFLSLVEEELQTPLAAAKIEAEGRALRSLAAVVSPSQSTLRDTVSRYGIAARICRVIPNAVAPAAGAPSWSVEGCERKTILFVGRFDKRKGGDTVLLAFRRLLQADAGLKLVFVGPDAGLTDGASRVFFEQYASELFTPAERARIDYRGQLPRTRIPELRARAMLCVVASRWENQANTALEAMLQGCPLVALDTGGTAEIVEHGASGLLARGGDIEDLCGKIMSLIEDPAKAQRLGEKARRFVAERHSLEALAQRNLALYREAAALAGTQRMSA